MLDTEEKVDKFLSDLKVELMKGRMSQGEYGSIVEMETSGGKLHDADQMLSYPIEPIYKAITIKIYPEPKTIICVDELSTDVADKFGVQKPYYIFKDKPY